MSRPSSHYARGSAFMLTPGALPAAAPSTSIPCWSPVPTDLDVRTDDARVSGARKLDLGPTTGHVENVRFGSLAERLVTSRCCLLVSGYQTPVAAASRVWLIRQDG